MKFRFHSYRRTAAIAVSAVLALVLGVAIGWQMRAPSAKAQENALAVAEAETGRFYQALSGSGGLDELLGDAFQLIRTDGRRHDRASYLADQPTVGSYQLDGFRAAQAGDVVTATFFSSNRAVIEGVAHATVGQPRLALFSQVDGEWKLQAFANLGVGLAGDIKSEAETAVSVWTSTAASGDVAALREILAPEFQIVRSNGAAYNAEEYLAGGLPRIDAIIDIDNVVATGFGDHMVVRYDIDVDETVTAGQIKGKAPRLTVFRRGGDGWLVVAHANFAPVV